MEEITAEYRSEELLAAVELRVVPKVTLAAKTDIGRQRDNNEDKFEFYIPEDPRQLAAKGLIFLVCDGMGGHEAGQIASELATKTFIDVYLNHTAQDVPTAAEAAIVSANRLVCNVGRTVPSRKGLGCTLSALMLVQDRAWIAHVGDSRIYRLRGGEVAQMTNDHTWVEEQVRWGVIDREAAEAHPYRHMLTRAIGAEEGILADIESFEIEVGDTFLVCSDGLTNHADELDILHMLTDHSPAQAAWRLVSHALQGGGSDNCTVLIVRVDALDHPA